MKVGLKFDHKLTRGEGWGTFKFETELRVVVY